LKGFTPLSIYFNHSLIIEEARIVVVDVQSPATLFVLSAAFFNINAPIFLYLSSKSIVLTIETQSLITSG